MPRVDASRSRSRACNRSDIREADGGVSEPDSDNWARWEPFGSNRGGKGAPRGHPPQHCGPDAQGSWRHDLFGLAPAWDPAHERVVDEPWLPPRGLGSGRSCRPYRNYPSCAVMVQNLDTSASDRDLWRLFAKVSRLVSAWIEDDGRNRGVVEFESAADAMQAVRRYHRHPWKGGRPLNVALQRSR
mmetsp:Transcript_21746/g.67900  ORF Transcript_21746/g.67900 Transcript_21746/m.67900 type:complete len:186 (-) Transcript_21746:227-784(-)